MTAHIMMQHSEKQAWPMMVESNWPVTVATAEQSCGGSTWSKRMAMESDSWEVRAFAEDHASSSGQWPPRSYSCSFCQREFRTAQALGGHMNVHRRERAHANQLASLRSAAARLSAATTVESKAQIQSTLSLSTVPLSSSSSPPSPSSSTSSESSTAIMMHSDHQLPGTKPLLQSIPDILSNTNFCPQTSSATNSWAPSRGGISYHPYERSSPSRCKPRRVSQSGARFSFCLNKVMGDHQHKDALDLELRLGRSSCAV